MPRAISYVRFSHPNQALGASEARQLDHSRAYCAEHGLTLDESDIYIDEGKSGYFGAHLEGDFGRFLAALDQGMIEPGSFILVDTMDRLSRQNPVLAMHQLTGIVSRGINVVTMTDQQVYTDKAVDAHKLFYSLGLMIGAFSESDKKAGWIRDARARKRAAIQAAYQNLDNTGPRPIMTRTLPAWVSYDAKLGRLVENENGKIVRRIFRDFADGIASHTLAIRLNKETVPLLTGNRTVWKKGPRKGKPIGRLWHPARIVNIIKSDVPLGWYQPYTRHRVTARKVEKRPAGSPIKDYYPQVVSYELAEQARAQLASRVDENGRAKGGNKGGRRKGGRTGEYTNLFTGWAKCECGEAMVTVSRTKGGKTWRWLHCRDPKCDNKATVRLDHLEAAVLEDAPWASRIAKSIPKFDQSADINRSLAEKRGEIEMLVKASENLTQEMAKGIGPLMLKQIERMEARHAELLSEIAELERQLRSSAVKHDGSDGALKAKILGEMQSEDLSVRYAARAKVATALRKIYKEITFDRGKQIRLDIARVKFKRHTFEMWNVLDADVKQRQPWHKETWTRVLLNDDPQKAFEYDTHMLPLQFIMLGVMTREDEGRTLFDDATGLEGLNEKQSELLYWLVEDANLQSPGLRYEDGHRLHPETQSTVIE